jgi:hypothetical protein
MGAATKYETDFYGWTQEQAALLRARRLDELDIDNLLEEVESMGKSEESDLESRLEILFMHLLKWVYEPELRGKSWVSTIKEQRRKIPRRLKKNPGLKSKLEEITAEAYEDARQSASDETGLPEQTFPKHCPWGLEEALNPEFWPD